MFFIRVGLFDYILQRSNLKFKTILLYEIIIILYKQTSN